MPIIGYALGAIELIIAGIGLLIAVITGLAVLIMKLPPMNPLRALLSALLMRLGVSLGGAVIATPVTTVPGLGEVGDAAIAFGVLYFWLTFFVELHKHLKQFRFREPGAAASTRPPVIIDHP